MSQNHQEIDESAAPVEKPAGDKGKKAKKRKQDEPALPFLVELVFQFSGLFLLLITISVALISYLSGAQFVEIFIRTGAALVICGFLTLIMSAQISQGAFDAASRAETVEEAPAAGAASGKDIKA